MVQMEKVGTDILLCVSESTEMWASSRRFLLPQLQTVPAPMLSEPWCTVPSNCESQQSLPSLRGFFSSIWWQQQGMYWTQWWPDSLHSKRDQPDRNLQRDHRNNHSSRCAGARLKSQFLGGRSSRISGSARPDSATEWDPVTNKKLCQIQITPDQNQINYSVKRENWKVPQYITFAKSQNQKALYIFNGIVSTKYEFVGK